MLTQWFFYQYEVAADTIFHQRNHFGQGQISFNSYLKSLQTTTTANNFQLCPTLCAIRTCLFEMKNIRAALVPITGTFTDRKNKSDAP